jgi:response regulator RpfG family c-di-GMP phosphodiesterase
LTVAIIILSARGSVEDRVKGLLIGSDDYLTKPFAMLELQARVHTLIRRTHGNADPAMLEVGDLSMNLPRHEVRRAGRSVDLKPRKYSLGTYTDTYGVATIEHGIESMAYEVTKQLAALNRGPTWLIFEAGSLRMFYFHKIAKGYYQAMFESENPLPLFIPRTIARKP